MNDAEEMMAGFDRRCREAGLKQTPQRREIYRQMLHCENHPSIEEVYRQVRCMLPHISLDTVYRTLATFERHGIVSQARLFGDRTRYDARTAPHYHFICRECGRVIDVFPDDLDRPEPLPDNRELGMVESCHMEFRGLCRDCLDNS
ncbi:MAG: transcriptional repressor [Deltaproteobacteria bacterium]|nr:transcriptional repressor [Candidatus Anaeroferrophillacea bacterium]